MEEWTRTPQFPGSAGKREAHQVDRHVADDVVMGRGIESLGLVEFVTGADVKTGPQSRDSLRHRFAPRDGIVGEHDVHEVVQIHVRFESVVPVPYIEPVTTRRTSKIDADILLEHFRVRGIEGIGQAIELSHLLERREEAESHDVE